MGKKYDGLMKILKTLIMTVPVICLMTLFLFKGVKAEAAVTGTVTATALFVREGPGTNYEILKLDGEQVRLVQGTYVAVSWEENGWYYITASFKNKAVTGYVAKDFVKASGAIPTGKPAATPTPATGDGSADIPKGTTLAVFTKGFPYNGWVVATTLNIREGAGTNYKITDTLKDGDQVTVTGVKKSSVGAYWYTISYTKDGKTKTGTTSASYIAVQIKTTGTPTPVPEDSVATLRTYGFPLEGKVLADALNVRESASISAKRLTILAQNEKVTALSAEKDKNGTWWYKISYTKNNVKGTGYVVSDYLWVSAPLPTPTPDVNDPNADIIRYYEIPTNEKGTLYYGATVNADVLNVRDSASTSGKSLVKIKQNTKVIILERLSTKAGYWYKLAVKQKGKVYTGYSSADYLRLDFENGVYALVNKANTALRTAANGSATTAVRKDGTQVIFYNGEKINLIGETETGGEKWFKVRLSDGTEGYVIRTEVELTGGNVSTAAPTSTPTPTPKYSTTPTPTPKPSTTPIPSGFPTPMLRQTDEGYPHNYENTELKGYGVLKSGTTSFVYDIPRPGSITVSGKNGGSITINDRISLALFDMYSSDGVIFRQVRFVHNDEVYYGYVEENKIRTLDEDELKTKVTPTPIPDLSNMQDGDYFEYMLYKGFPYSYVEELMKLHTIHPNWIFDADLTYIDWDTVVERESRVGVNLIPNTRNSAMLSTADGAYDWKTDTYKVYDSPSWVTASEEANAYYLDPRNWLDETSIFMFETLSYKPKYQTLEEVEDLLKGTPFYNTSFTFTDDSGKTRTISYAQAFIEAAEYSGVSPYHLVTRVRQEVVTGSNSVSNSASGKVSGYTGYYNFYNIGAYHSTTTGGAIINGLKYAKNGLANSDDYNDASLIPWNNPYRAIVGGAYIIAQQYIARGQDTIYLQKFNVTNINTFNHQYMANVEAPVSESKRLAQAYDSSNAVVIFKIPVYVDMPETNAEKPTGTGSPNNALSALEIYDLSGRSLTMSPEFDPVNDSDYYVTTSENNNVIQIYAIAASEKATISGTGTVVVNSNSDVFEIRVTAENGSVRTYRIHASKK